jgi:diguanylate cyclase (GGDEF)-like protein
MEVVLWRWSTAVQGTSAVMIALFFVVLARSVGRAELKPWATAWLANVVALLIPITYWFLQPDSQFAHVSMRWGYFMSKTVFATLLVIGASELVGGGLTVRAGPRLLVAVAVYSTVASLLVEGFIADGAVQSAVTAVLLFGGAVLITAKGAPGSGWLVCGFASRAALAAVEAAAYSSRLIPNRLSSSSAVGFFLSSHSSLDAAAEWVIALGSLLVFYRTIQQELMLSNTSLLATQSVLREMVEIDPLTGLANRRSLPPVLAGAVSTGATVLFFDLDDFKGINDAYGHQAGDDYLRRFAAALKASFGADGHLSRYAGDEFVAVTRSLDPDTIADRLERLEKQLRSDRSAGPKIRYAVGYAQLAAGGDPDEALRAADEAMYDAKRSRL